MALDAIGELVVLTDVIPPPDLSSTISLRAQREARRASSPIKRIKNNLAHSITSVSQMTCVLAIIQSRLNSRLDTIDNSLAPINLLPVEILRFIFLLLLSSQQSNRFARSDVLRISQVSLSWRATALGCSALWTRIHAEWSMKRQNIWLSRARHQPLDIVANCSNAPRVSASRIQLSTNIWGSRNRWRSLAAYNYGFGDLQALVRPALTYPVECMVMHSMVLHTGSDAVDNYNILLNAHLQIPQATELRLSGLQILSSPNTPHLARIYLSNVQQSAIALSNFLNSCHELQVLVLDNVDVDVRGSIHSVMLKSLLELRLTLRNHQSELQYFTFRWVCAPKLRSFHLDVDILPYLSSDCYIGLLWSLEGIVSLVRSCYVRIR